jgi:hypothetical protein
MLILRTRLWIVSLAGGGHAIISMVVSSFATSRLFWDVRVL